MCDDVYVFYVFDDNILLFFHQIYRSRSIYFKATSDGYGPYEKLVSNINTLESTPLALEGTSLLRFFFDVDLNRDRIRVLRGSGVHLQTLKYCQCLI